MHDFGDGDDDDDVDEPWEPVERWEFFQDEVSRNRMFRAIRPERTQPLVVVERYEMLKFLGSGGWGAVFLARDIVLDRLIAFKLLKRDDADAEAMLRHEARCLAKLEHPNVVTLFDIDRFHYGLFVTMQYVEGQNAHRWMHSGESLSWSEVLHVFLQAGRGLAAAHAAGVEHGDFKPENILIGNDGVVRVADFGIARVFRGGSPTQEPPETIGTYVYMPPERFDGVVGDPRSDQFSFCVALWECLYGGRPFKGETVGELVGAMLTKHPRVERALPRMPQRLQKILRVGLSPEPEQRHASMEVLLHELESLPELPKRRRRWIIGLAALAGAVQVGRMTVPHDVLADLTVLERSAIAVAQNEERPEPRVPSVAELAALAHGSDPLHFWTQFQAADEQTEVSTDDLLMLAGILEVRAAALSAEHRVLPAEIAHRLASRALLKAHELGHSEHEKQARESLARIELLSRDPSAVE